MALYNIPIGFKNISWEILYLRNDTFTSLQGVVMYYL